ncbi:hypothetical protein DL766_001208 [Monosporascus sp. MC13-8B]|uniref:Uncharacterized protein n=1 Tax=Monosporascus cannonballus TaxID=155416 RepID=A0ABY0GXH6_9PEZI|nr:hypothetical protein DL762_008094 [Monosporascus cannonballus]RYO91737.1 hypothetical protein DL763_004887 [Monosporascus cannonballus]RYP38026.1 hypothetical protein DL766_001208 [Monosporascus sp. MC13-8B]
MSSPQAAEASRLIKACYATLRSSRSRTPREYYGALTLADSALALATEGGPDDGLVRQCEILRDFCQNSLRSAYGRSDLYQRDVYERAASGRGAEADDSDADTASSGSAGDAQESPSEVESRAAEPVARTRSVRWV